MRKANQFVLAACGLLACSTVLGVGCSQSTTNEPQAVDTFVEEHVAEKPVGAEPIVEEPIVEQQAADPIPTAAVADAKAQVEPVKQANFEDLSDAADEASAADATVPPVELSNAHAELCRVKVGDSLPDVELPQVEGGNTKLSSLYGKAATVVVFWKGDRQMALDELADLGPDVVQKFGSRGVEVVGVAVDQPATDAQSALQKSAATFPQLVDADGKAFEQVGSQMLPWTLVLDADGKIVWFDLEYSLSTRRELQQALLATVR